LMARSLVLLLVVCFLRNEKVDTSPFFPFPHFGCETQLLVAQWEIFCSTLWWNGGTFHVRLPHISLTSCLRIFCPTSPKLLISLSPFPQNRPLTFLFTFTEAISSTGPTVFNPLLSVWWPWMDASPSSPFGPPSIRRCHPVSTSCFPRPCFLFGPWKPAFCGVPFCPPFPGWGAGRRFFSCPSLIIHGAPVFRCSFGSAFDGPDRPLN